MREVFWKLWLITVTVSYSDAEIDLVPSLSSTIPGPDLTTLLTTRVPAIYRRDDVEQGQPIRSWPGSGNCVQHDSDVSMGQFCMPEHGPEHYMENCFSTQPAPAAGGLHRRSLSVADSSHVGFVRILPRRTEAPLPHVDVPREGLDLDPNAIIAAQPAVAATEIVQEAEPIGGGRGDEPDQGLPEPDLDEVFRYYDVHRRCPRDHVCMESRDARLTTRVSCQPTRRRAVQLLSRIFQFGRYILTQIGHATNEAFVVHDVTINTEIPSASVSAVLVSTDYDDVLVPQKMFNAVLLNSDGTPATDELCHFSTDQRRPDWQHCLPTDQRIDLKPGQKVRFGMTFAAKSITAAVLMFRFAALPAKIG